MDEKIVVAYIKGEVRVPDDFWAIVKKYRQLEQLVETQGQDHVAAMNTLYDALVVLDGKEKK